MERSTNQKQKEGNQYDGKSNHRAAGSISVSDFNLQKNGYVNALTTYLPTDGSVAIGVWDFESVDHLVFNGLVISSAADKTALINAIAGISYIGGNTALGDSISVTKSRPRKPSNVPSRLIQN